MQESEESSTFNQTSPILLFHQMLGHPLSKQNVWSQNIPLYFYLKQIAEA